jgi:hypothetical protein
MVKLRCIRHANILKRADLCRVSDTGSPEPLVLEVVAILFFCQKTSKIFQKIVLIINNYVRNYCK